MNGENIFMVLKNSFYMFHTEYVLLKSEPTQ